MNRPGVAHAVGVVLGATTGVTAVSAQGYPDRPIRYIVPFAAGGGQDIVARQIAPRLGERLGQPVVVDNRPGGGATLGPQLAAASTPDGYTILMASNTTHAINPHLYRKLGYDPVTSFAPVTQIAALANILVVPPTLPARSVKELVELARTRAGELNFGSAGNGTPAQLAGVMFNQVTGLRILHVPYKGAGPALTALLAGETHMMFGSMTASIAHVRSQRLRALAVTGPRRSGAVPDVPTVAESGYPGFEATTWYGVVVPAGTLRPVVSRLHAELIDVLNSPEVRRFLIDQGAEPVGSSPQAFGAYIESELVKYARIVKDSGIRAD